MANRLADIPPFSALAPEDLSRIDQIRGEVSAPRGHVLFQEGAKVQNIWIFRSGGIFLFKESVRGRPVCLRMAAPLSCLELPSGFAHGARHSMTACALETSMLFHVPIAEFLSLFESRPSFARKCACVAEQALRELQEYNAQAQEPARVRLAYHLLRLSEGGTLPVRLTKREMASLIGASIESVFRVLSAFRRRGWLRSSGGDVWVTKASELGSLCHVSWT